MSFWHGFLSATVLWFALLAGIIDFVPNCNITTLPKKGEGTVNWAGFDMKVALLFHFHDPPLEETSNWPWFLIAPLRERWYRLTHPYNLLNWERWAARIMVGPTDFAVVMVAFDSGLVDHLRSNPSKGLTVKEVGGIVGSIYESNIFHFLNSAVGVGLLEWSGDQEVKLRSPAMSDAFMERFKVTLNATKWLIYRQSWHLHEALRTQQPAGLRAVYGKNYTNLYASCEHDTELYHAWTPWMDMISKDIDVKMMSMFPYPPNAKVLDVAGQTGLSAVNLLKVVKSIKKVMVIDLPFKKDMALKRFAAEGVSDKADFEGGDAFTKLPTGYDVIQVKHFINMFNETEVGNLFKSAYNALSTGGQFLSFHLHCGDNPAATPEIASFLPTYFISGAMGKGGAFSQKHVAKMMYVAGFKQVDVYEIEPPHSVVMGTK